MKRFEMSIVLTVGLAALGLGCSRHGLPETKKKELESLKNEIVSDLPPPSGQITGDLIDQRIKLGKKREAAALLTRMGELLLVPKTFGYALPKFEQALTLDPTSGRAQFYVAVLKPLASYQGILSRSMKLGDAEHQKKMRERMRRLTEGSHKNYAEYWQYRPKGTALFANFKEAQDFIEIDAIPALKKSTDALDALKNTAVELNIPLDAWKNSASNFSPCESDGKQWKCSDAMFRNLRIQLDSVDRTLAHSALSTLLNAHRMSVAYSLEQVEQTFPELRAKKNIGPSIAKVEPLLKLRPHHELATIRSELSTVLKQAYDTVALQDAICNNSDRKRSEVFLASLCEKDGALDNALAIVRSLEGVQDLQYGLDEEGKPLLVEADLGQPFLKPLPDLKIFARDEHADPTYGGVFPNMDASEKNRLIREGKHQLEPDLKWSILLRRTMSQ